MKYLHNHFYVTEETPFFKKEAFLINSSKKITKLDYGF